MKEFGTKIRRDEELDRGTLSRLRFRCVGSVSAVEWEAMSGRQAEQGGAPAPWVIPGLILCRRTW